jgi:hypothetical protein
MTAIINKNDVRRKPRIGSNMPKAIKMRLFRRKKIAVRIKPAPWQEFIEI